MRPTFVAVRPSQGLLHPSWVWYVLTLFAFMGVQNRTTCFASEDRPNIVLIFTDDQGYGDLSCYGSKTLQTPRLDSLAKDGTRFTSFYAQVVCGPSRSALLTGRYPHRSLGWSMPATEITVAEILQRQGYATGCIGKWDVSNRAAIRERMPNAKGFDYYFGTLGANDNGRVILHENNERVDETNDMASLTRLYTDKSIAFIERNQKQPFFLYLAHTMVHSVIDASPEFRGKSNGGLYGDTVQELDFHSGRLLDAIDRMGLREKTLVLFTTDNGAWNNFQENLGKKHNDQIAWGSSGPLREGKGSTYEGGLRVPCLARWPGKVPAGRVSDGIFATIDFLPTLVALAGGKTPSDRWIDGVDQSELLTGKSELGARNDYFFFCKNELHAVRKGPFKLLLSDRRQHYGYVKDKGSDRIELYDLSKDLGEKRNIADQHPEIVRELLEHATSIPMPDVHPDDRIAIESRANLSNGAAAKALKVGDWDAHGLALEGRERIRGAFQEGIDQKWIPGGSLLIMHRGEIVLREAFGSSDLISQNPFSIDSPCRIASVTKPFTATLMAILADRGYFRLNDPIDLYLPSFQQIHVQGDSKLARPPTISECLSHTAGFVPNNAVDREMFDRIDQITLGKAVDRLAKEEFASHPGTKYAYSRGGYLVAGRIAEVVTGRTFQDLLRRHLLENMGAETATLIPDAQIVSRIPILYDRKDGSLFPKSDLARPRFVNPGGDLVATIDDVAKLLLLHRNRGKVGSREIVSEDTLSKTWQSQPNTPGVGYGLGFSILAKHSDGSPSRIQHTGATGTLAMLDFDHDVIVVILTQVDQSKIGPWRNRLGKVIEEVCLVSKKKNE